MRKVAFTEVRIYIYNALRDKFYLGNIKLYSRFIYPHR